MTDPVTDTDRLRDLLAQTTPTDPDLTAAERSAAVVRRGRAARRRDRALVAGAAAAVLVVAVAVPLALRDGDDAEPDVAATPTAAPCPTDPIDMTQPGELLGIGDVVAVRACPAVGEDGEPLPSQPLVGDDAAAFADDVEALPAYQMPQMCLVASIKPQPWALRVETTDGTAYFLGSTMRTCSSLSIGRVDRGTDAILAAFTGNLVRQRSGIPDLACPPGERLADGAPTWNASFGPSTATAGVVCYRADPMGADEYDGVEATLDDAQLAAIRDDLASNREQADDGGMCIDTGPQRLVVLEDADGDQAAWVDDRCTGQFAGPGGYWMPGQEAQQAIEDALTRGE